MNETTIQTEFHDYLERASSSHRARRDGVLSYEDFRELLGRWQREYHQAWAGNDRSRMAELERALALDV